MLEMVSIEPYYFFITVHFSGSNYTFD